MFPAQCQRGVTGGAVSAKPALTKRETPPHTHTPYCHCVPFLGLQPSSWGTPLSPLSKNLWKVQSCLLNLVSGRSSGE